MNKKCFCTHLAIKSVTTLTDYTLLVIVHKNHKYVYYTRCAKCRQMPSIAFFAPCVVKFGSIHVDKLAFSLCY